MTDVATNGDWVLPEQVTLAIGNMSPSTEVTEDSTTS